MNRVTYLQSLCIKKLQKYINILLATNIYTKDGISWANSIYHVNILLPEFENIKPFLKKISYKLCINTDSISIADEIKLKQNIQYLYYIIKGHDMTIQSYCRNNNESVYYKKLQDHHIVSRVNKKIIVIYRQCCKLIRIKKKLITRKYIDQYTDMRFCNNIMNYIVSYV
jgi:hypothetical protein